MIFATIRKYKEQLFYSNCLIFPANGRLGPETSTHVSSSFPKEKTFDMSPPQFEQEILLDREEAGETLGQPRDNRYYSHARDPMGDFRKKPTQVWTRVDNMTSGDNQHDPNYRRYYRDRDMGYNGQSQHPVGTTNQ